MPIDLEMFLSAAATPYFEYSTFGDHRFSVTNAYNHSGCRRSISLPSNHFFVQSHDKQLSFKRPDFHSYAQEHCKSKKSTGSAAELPFGARKKKVSFADDRGFNLVEVREIPGAQKWADDVLTLLIGDTKHSLRKEKKWKKSFQHPPWEDEKLVNKLEKNAVALESVKVSEEIISGTIKVKNLAYEKNVFARITFDRWMSYVDVPATYVRPSGKQSGVYDTFSFSTRISPAATKYEVIELCVCFRCNGGEFWDNNGGINFRLVHESNNWEEMPNDRTSNAKNCSKMTVSLTDNFEQFSGIDYWNPFIYGQPYW